MIALIAFVVACVLVIYMANSGIDMKAISSGNINDNNTYEKPTWDLNLIWILLIEEYGLPFVQFCMSIMYTCYFQLTVSNVAKFIVKFIPSGYYTFKWLRYFYRSSQEIIKQKQIEVEDLQLQIRIVKEKLGVRDSELCDLTGQLRRDAQRLREVRARVRQLLSADEELRQALGDAAPWPCKSDTDQEDEEEPECIMDLLEEMTKDQTDFADALPGNDCGDHVPRDSGSGDDSFYSSPDNGNLKQDCHVKIVKVTNVYKVAYLKQYIKQKKIRRQALLKKKIESIKKLLESWQKSLNLVINSKLLLDTSNTLDAVSQEAMGDYSKPNVRDSDSDSDLIKNNENYFNEYKLGWAQNLYRNYNNLSYNFEEGIPGATISKEYNEAQEYCDYPSNLPGVCEYSSLPPNMLFILPEETSSQMAMAIQDSAKEKAAEFESEC